MKTDRELLELAARACGYRISYWTKGVPRIITSGTHRNTIPVPWDPLHDDDDALRLVVKLRLEICFYDGFEEVHVSDQDGNQTVEHYGFDMNLVVRRAITRAAAAIGEQMPC